MRIRKWPWGRIVTGVMAAIILLFAMNLFFASADIRRHADAAQTVELAHVEADLSKPGTYEGSLCLEKAVAYGLRVQIATKPPVTSTEEARSILAGLAGHLTIVGPDRDNVFENALRCEDFACRRVDPMPRRWAITTDMEYCPFLERWRQGSTDRAKDGIYQFKLTIDHGAARLADIPHAVVIQYQLDGMEYYVAGMACIYGIVGCTIAGILVLAIVLVTIKKRRTIPTSGLGSDSEVLL